jgi:hypothetical protein
MIVRKHIVYPGIEKPGTLTELKVEMFGLKNAIKIAEELISRYEQVVAIMELKQEEMSNASQAKSTVETQESEGAEGDEAEGNEGAESRGPEESA